ncbi:MAG: hypothetical protein LBV21_01735 [Candidatus Adiutrix sp.]|jgi:hypothetical protein|nr:hypothetical protein [Candidatus Adiutrix sp.]
MPFPATHQEIAEAFRCLEIGLDNLSIRRSNFQYGQSLGCRFSADRLALNPRFALNRHS